MGEKHILVVTRNGRLSEPVMEYSVNVAKRLECKLLVAYVNTMPLLGAGVLLRSKREATIKDSTEQLNQIAAQKEVQVTYVQESGRVSQVIRRLCRIIKRVEFVVIDKNISVEKASSGASVPVFNVLSGNLPVTQKKKRTGSYHSIDRSGIPRWKRRQLKMKALSLTAATCGLYLILFFQHEQIMLYWTRGGLYSILPVLTTFLFFGVQTLLAKNILRLLKSGDIRRDGEPIAQTTPKHKTTTHRSNLS